MAKQAMGEQKKKQVAPADGSGRHPLEKENAELKSRLQQAEKMESIGRMAAGIAHELKNPLATISMGVSAVERRALSGDTLLKSAAEEMREAILRADAIVKGLLEYSAPMELALSRESVHGLIQTALRLLNHNIDHSRVRVIQQYDRRLPEMLLDRGKMVQVFVNLLQNAAQAMPDGGTLTVTTCIDPEKEPEHVLVEVADTGHGIPEHVMDRIFDPFFTTRPAGGGTGLGLALTASIIRLHGGRIMVTSSDPGTRFTVVLPLREPHANPKPEEEDETNTRNGN